MIDWPRVTELRSEVGAEDFGEIVDLFLEEVEEVIAELRADDNRGQLEQRLHFLKGSALNLGFQTFSSLCQEGERDSAQGKSDSVDITSIISSFEASKNAFVSALPDKF